MRLLFLLFAFFVSTCTAQDAKKHYSTLCNLPIAASPATTKVSVLVDGKPAGDISWKVTDAPSRLVIVNDISGSMRDPERQRVALEAARDFGRASRPANKLALVNFNDDSYLDIDLRERDAFLKETENPRIIDKFEGRGGTAILDAIYSSSLRLSHDRQEGDAIVLISDGLDNSSRHDEKEVREKLASGGIRLYLLVLTGSPSPRAIVQLVHDSGGILIGSAKSAFKNKPDSLTQMNQQIEALSRIIQQPARVEFALPTPPSSHSKLRIDSTSAAFGTTSPPSYCPAFLWQNP